MFHTYYAKACAPDIGTIPRIGLVDFLDFGEGRAVPGITGEAYGCAVYCRALRPDEVERFGLCECDYGENPILFRDIMLYADQSGAAAAIDLMSIVGVDCFEGTALDYDDIMDILSDMASMEERSEL